MAIKYMQMQIKNHTSPPRITKFMKNDMTYVDEVKKELELSHRLIGIKWHSHFGKL